MLIKHQLRSNFFIIFGFHPLFDKEPLEVAVADNVLVTVLVPIVPLQGFDDVQDDILYPVEATP